MSGDGAHQGVSAARAIETILGGAPPPSDDEGMSPEEMHDWLLASPGPPDMNDSSYMERGIGAGSGYEQAAREAGRRVLQAYIDHPELVDLPMDDRYEYTDPENFQGRHLVEKGLYGTCQDLGIEIDGELGLSGFMYGWAVNAARYALGARPQQNPAIVDITLED